MKNIKKSAKLCKRLELLLARIGSVIIISGLTPVFDFDALTTSPFSINGNIGLLIVLAIMFAFHRYFTVSIVLLLQLETRRLPKSKFTTALRTISSRDG